MIKQHIGRQLRAALNGFEPPQNVPFDIDVNEQPSSIDVEPIWQSLQEFYRNGMHPYVGLCIRHRGQLLFNRSIGYSRLGERGVDDALAGDIDTPVCLFSASKTPSAMLVHKLAEQGAVDLLNPVSYYLPAFAKNGKAGITLLDMLSHRSGFPFIDVDIDVEMVFDLDGVFDLICDMPCLDSDGRVQAYHAVSSGFVVAKLVEETLGISVSEYLDQTIRQPLGMRNFNFGYRDTSDSPVAHNYNTGGPEIGFFNRRLARCMGLPFENIVEVSNEASFQQSVVPSGNIYATAEEIGRFFQVLLDGGRWQDEQVFESTTVQQAVREAGPARIDRALGFPLRFSAGMMLGGNPVGMYGLKTHNAFGHLGLSNIFAWADPDRDISVGLVNTGKPVLGTHLLDLPLLVHKITSSFSQ